MTDPGRPRPPSLATQHPALYAWVVESYLRGLPYADLLAAIAQQTGVRYHQGTLQRWGSREHVHYGGDRRLTPAAPPQPAAPTAAPNEQARLTALATAIAARLELPPPQSWSEIEQVLLTNTPPADCELLLASSDWQGGFYDPAALHTRAQALRVLQPQVIYYGGDVFDAYDVGRFAKNPDLYGVMDLRSEADLIGAQIDRDRQLAPRAALWWKDGNHEYRLPKYLQEHAPALRGVAPDTPALLKATERGISWRPYTGPGSAPYDFHGLKLQHGAFSSTVVGSNAVTAKAMRKWPHSSGVLGHSHRAEVALHYSEGRLIQWYNIGCLCYLTPAMDYFEGAPDGWVQAFLVAWWAEGRLHCQLAVLQDHCCVVGGWYLTPERAYRL